MPGLMWRPSYFYRGYAVHGSASVPAYAASNGEEYQDQEDGHWLERHRDRLARSKAAGRTAAGVMSVPVITIGPEASVPVAARLLARHGSSACRSSTTNADWSGS